MASPASAAISRMTAMIFLISACPRAMAAMRSASETSLAPASTITTLSAVAARRSSRSTSSRSLLVGLTIHSPLTRPTRTAPMGWSKGMGERATAALAALMARMSGSLIPSAEKTRAMTWVSCL